VIAVLFAVAAGVVLSRSITVPLGKVTRVAQQIAAVDLQALSAQMGALAQGNLNGSLTISANALDIRAKDEIGQLAQAFTR